MASLVVGVSGRVAIPTRDARVQFIFAGFSQEAEFRVFTFEDTAKDQAIVQYKVRANLDSARRNGIQTQELPLLCRGILERSGRGDQSTFEFSDDDMLLYSNHCKNVKRTALLKKKSRVRPMTVPTQTGWRTVPPTQLEA